MAKVQYQIESEGVAALVQQMNNLTRAERDVVAGATGMDNALGKAGRKGQGLKKAARGALELAGALGAVVSVSGAISAGFQEVQRQIQETINLGKQAQAFGRAVEQGRGKLIANDPNLNAADRARIDAAIRQTAPQLGKQGAQRAADLFADVRTATPGASLDAQLGGFRIAARQTALTGVDDLSQLAPQAAANIRIQQALRREGVDATATTAQNLLVTAGSRAGIDTSQVGSAILPLLGAKGATTAEKAALLGFGTAETGFGGERISTGVSSLLQRLSKPSFSDAPTGTEFTLEGGSEFAKLQNLLDRIQGGQLDRAAASRAVAGDDATKNALLNALLGNRDTFGETLALTRGSTTIAEDLQGNQIAEALAQSPQLASTISARTAEGQSVFRAAGDVQARTAADVAQSITARRVGLGLISPTDEQITLNDLETQAARASRRSGGLGEFERRAQLRDLQRAFGVSESAGVGGFGPGIGPAFVTPAERFRRAFATGGEQGAFASAIEQGFVSPSDGISGAERAALSSVGIADASLDKLQQAFIAGNEDLYRKLFPQIIAEAVRLIQAGPQAQDLNP